MSSTTTLYNAWFCSFAQQAWLALLEKGVKFTYVEQDPYNKSPEWLAVNPRGLVPAIVHNGKLLVESTVCIEYVDEAWSTDRHLLPSDPYERAQVRLLSDHITKKVTPLYYQLLMKKTEAERAEARRILSSHSLHSLKVIQAVMAHSSEAKRSIRWISCLLPMRIGFGSS